jgi:hypothetical protein
MSTNPNDKTRRDDPEKRQRSRPEPDRPEKAGQETDETDNSPADQTGRAEVPESAPKSN